MNNTPEWATGGEHQLKLDSNDLRGFGENIAALGANLLDDSTGPMLGGLYGSGDNVSLSTGGLQAGKALTQLDGVNAQSMLQFCRDEYQTLLADSSAYHTLADIYESGDGNNAISLNAIQWVYQEGGKPPAGVPAYLYDENGKLKTVADMFKNDEVPDGGPNNSKGDTVISQVCLANGDIVTKYRTADGGTRTVTENAQGITETMVNKDNVPLYQMVTTPGGGSTTTTLFEKDGKTVQSKTTRTVETTTTTDRNGAQVVHEQTTISKVDGQGNPAKDAKGNTIPVQTEHVETTTKNGVEERKYYTTTQGSDDRTNERNINPQPVPSEPEDWQRLAEEESDRARAAM